MLYERANEIRPQTSTRTNKHMYIHICVSNSKIYTQSYAEANIQTTPGYSDTNVPSAVAHKHTDICC